MTDYLEELLEEQEQDVEEQPDEALLEPGVVLQKRRRREDASEENAGNRTEGAPEGPAARWSVRKGVEERLELKASAHGGFGVLEGAVRTMAADREGPSDGRSGREETLLWEDLERKYGILAAGGAQQQAQTDIVGEIGAEVVRSGGSAEETPPVRPVYPELPQVAESGVPQWLSEGEDRALVYAGRMAQGVGARTQAERGAAWLEQRLRAGAAAAGYAGRGGESVTVVEQAGRFGGGGLSPVELDRALERDARRYDGGFALFG